MVVQQTALPTQKTDNTHRLWLISRIFPPSSRNRARKRTSFTRSLKTSKGSKVIVFADTRDTDILADMMYEEERLNRCASHTPTSHSVNVWDSQSVCTIKDHSFIRHRGCGSGLDVKDVSHVVLHDFPNQRESSIEDFVHRIGRTARGNERACITFFHAERDKHQAGACPKF